MDKKAAVIFDVGSVHVQCGFAGEYRPRCALPSPGAAATTADWTLFLDRVYTEYLQCRPSERRVVVCESLVCEQSQRENLKQALLASLGAPLLSCSPGPSLALFATSSSTGLVLDIGDREAHIMAVCSGVVVMRSIGVYALGCEAIRRGLFTVLQQQLGGQPYEGNAMGALLDNILMRSCLLQVGGVPAEEQVADYHFLFKGGVRVSIPGSARILVPGEAFFGGDDECNTLATVVLDCLERCPQDARKGVASHILVTGGGGMIPGLCGRLKEEILLLANSDNRYSWARPMAGVIRMVKAPCARSHMVWQGASAFFGREDLPAHIFSKELPDWMSVG